MYFCYETQRAAQFIDECQFLANRYMLYNGYSIGIDNYIVDNEFLKTDPLNPDVVVENVENKIMKMSRQQLSQNDNNGFMISVESGAKGRPIQGVPNDQIAWTTIYEW